MTALFASCPLHGQLELDVEFFRLVVCVEIPERSFYSFPCAGCEGDVVKELTPHVRQVFARKGKRWERLMIPAEALEPRRPDAFTPDEILDFHLGLAEL